MRRPPPRSTLFPYTTLFRSTALSTIESCGRCSSASRVGTTTPLTELSIGTTAERSEEHTSELQSQFHLVCRLLLEKKKEEDCDGRLQRRDSRPEAPRCCRM